MRETIDLRTGTVRQKQIPLNKRIGTILMDACLWVFSLSCLFPMLWIAYNSFKTKRVFNADKLGVPGMFGAEEPTLENYIKILTNTDYALWQTMGNSLVTTCISILFIVIFSFVVGYILARIAGKWNRPLYLLFLSGMLIPIHSLLVPIYVVFNEVGIVNRWYTLLLPYISFGMPMGIFLVESYIKGLTVSMEEAAAIDGSSFSRTMWTIVLPVCKPILVTVAIIQAFACWNEFSFALVLLSSKARYTVPLGLTQFKGQFDYDFPKQMAAMLVTMSPIIMIYLAFSNQIIKGMVTGAVKG